MVTHTEGRFLVDIDALEDVEEVVPAAPAPSPKRTPLLVA